MMTLWDLIEPFAKHLRPKVAPKTPPDLVYSKSSTPNARPSRGPTSSHSLQSRTFTAPAKSSPPSGSMLERYERMVAIMLERHNVRVRKWRTSSSGCAWQVFYRDGTISNLIESPRPRGPLSAAIFLHEIGHHAIGLDVYKPRCLEEYHAWMFALAAMKEHDLNITQAVHNRVRRSLKYAVGKATRRGIKNVPAELLEYM